MFNCTRQPVQFASRFSSLFPDMNGGTLFAPAALSAIGPLTTRYATGPYRSVRRRALCDFEDVGGSSPDFTFHRGAPPNREKPIGWPVLAPCDSGGGAAVCLAVVANVLGSPEGVFNYLHSMLLHPKYSFMAFAWRHDKVAHPLPVLTLHSCSWSPLLLIDLRMRSRRSTDSACEQALTRTQIASISSSKFDGRFGVRLG